jgi:hypothetical protein
MKQRGKTARRSQRSGNPEAESNPDAGSWLDRIKEAPDAPRANDPEDPTFWSTPQENGAEMPVEPDVVDSMAASDDIASMSSTSDQSDESDEAPWASRPDGNQTAEPHAPRDQDMRSNQPEFRDESRPGPASV